MLDAGFDLPEAEKRSRISPPDQFCPQITQMTQISSQPESNAETQRRGGAEGFHLREISGEVLAGPFQGRPLDSMSQQEVFSLLDYCQQRLDVIAFDDYCPNGLQVEGKGEVRRLVTGVTASLALVQAAVEAGADTLLVHHGYFWKNEPAPIVGMKGERIRLLLRHQVNLLAYHLPLDAHPKLGNNVKLGELIGCRSGAPVAAGGLLWGGELPEPATASV